MSSMADTRCGALPPAALMLLRAPVSAMRSSVLDSSPLPVVVAKPLLLPAPGVSLSVDFRVLLAGRGLDMLVRLDLLKSYMGIDW
jgi:hypothetical protein